MDCANATCCYEWLNPTVWNDMQIRVKLWFTNLHCERAPSLPQKLNILPRCTVCSKSFEMHSGCGYLSSHPSSRWCHSVNIHFIVLFGYDFLRYIQSPGLVFSFLWSKRKYPNKSSPSDEMLLLTISRFSGLADW